MARNHWDSFFFSTSAPERQPRPSRVPIDPGFLALDQPGLPEIQEQLLLLAVVADVAGGEFA